MTLHTPFARHPRILITTLLFVVVLLNACGGTIETDLTLRTDERFDATSRITVPVEALALVGGTEAVEAQFREIEQQAIAESVKFAWRREKSRSAGQIVYRVSLSGRGYEGLAEAYGVKVQKTQYQGQDALAVSSAPNYGLSGMESTVRLHVGKILETNNRRSDNNTIIWSSTEKLQAIVTPASDTGWLLPLIVVLLVAVVAVLAVLLLRRRPAGQVVRAPTAASAAGPGGFCPQCGQPVYPGAKYCMYCGGAIPPRGG